jgi:hypothetical protein
MAADLSPLVAKWAPFLDGLTIIGVVVGVAKACEWSDVIEGGQKGY